MGFGTGLVTGLASGFDKMMQLDMQRNQERLSRAETYALTRRQQKLERAETSGRKLKENLRELAALTGSNTRAAMAAEGVGGTNAAIEELVKDLKQERKKLGKGFDIGKFIDFTGEDTLKEPRTLADNFNRFREDIDFSVTMPKDLTKPRGLMGKLGFGLKRDVAADVEGMIDVPSEFTAERDTSAIPAGRISFDEGYHAREFADKFDDDDSDDPKYTSAQAMLAHATELKLKHPTDSAAYKQADNMYKMAVQAIQDAKKDETSDAAEKALSPTVGMKLVDGVKGTFYDAEFQESVGERIAAKFSGTNSYISYFQTQPDVIDEINKTYNNFAQDKTIGNFLRVEERAFATNSQAYLGKFATKDVPENKAYTFSIDPQTEETIMKANPAVEPETGSDFSTGDISMVKYYEDDADGNSQYVGDTLAVWRGKDWYYLR